MSEEQVKNIWDRYYKVDPSRKNRQFGESGLGLSIVEQLVRLHKGKISESELGKGTTFKISFPDIDLNEDSNRPAAIRLAGRFFCGSVAAQTKDLLLQASLLFGGYVNYR